MSDEDYGTCLWCQQSMKLETAVGACCWEGWKQESNASLARKDAALKMAVEAMVPMVVTAYICTNYRSSDPKWITPLEKLGGYLMVSVPPKEQLVVALAACREAMK